MKYWWIIANKEKHNWDWIGDLQVGATIEFDALSENGKTKKNFKQVRKNDKVICYSAGKMQVIVSLAIIERPLIEGEKSIEIKKIKDLEKPIPIEKIKSISLFDKKFDNIKLRTTIIPLNETEYNIILELENKIIVGDDKTQEKIKTENIVNVNVKEENEMEGNKKNINKRRKVLNSESEYEPYHDQMQNAIFELLKTSKRYDYKKVFIEKGGVDIKAKTRHDTWHYFELKTDNPKQSIREALGQILEYAYFPDTNKAEKLIIVADDKPSADVKKYLDHIRNKFNLPIAYRYFDLDKNELSDDY